MTEITVTLSLSLQVITTELKPALLLTDKRSLIEGGVYLTKTDISALINKLAELK